MEGWNLETMGITVWNLGNKLLNPSNLLLLLVAWCVRSSCCKSLQRGGRNEVLDVLGLYPELRRG